MPVSPESEEEEERPGPGPGRYTALALLPGRIPVIAYEDGNNAIRIAQRGADGRWSFESPFGATPPGMPMADSLSLVSSPTGALHLAQAFFNEMGGALPGLYYISKSDSWSKNTLLNPIERSGLYVVMALNPYSQVNPVLRPHLLYQNLTDDGRPHHVWKSGEDSWTPTDGTGRRISDTVAPMSPYLAMSIDSSGTVHTVYTTVTGPVERPDARINYRPLNPSGTIYRAGTTSSYDMGSSVTSTSPFYKDITIDSRGAIHIVFYHPANGDLLYATPSTFLQPTAIDRGFTLPSGSVGDVGRFVSMAVCDHRPNDSTDDTLHVAYYDNSQQRLRHAVRTSQGNWSLRLVVTTGDPADDGEMGQYSSLLCDEESRLHLAYYDSSTAPGSLKYAALNTGVCSNGIREAGEACDPSAPADQADGCRENCTWPPCGDRQCNSLENCQSCPSDCGECPATIACGNGVTEPGEDCDDRNREDTDDCRNNCRLPRCGDEVCSSSENCTLCESDCGKCPQAAVTEETPATEVASVLPTRETITTGQESSPGVGNEPAPVRQPRAAGGGCTLLQH